MTVICISIQKCDFKVKAGTRERSSTLNCSKKFGRFVLFSFFVFISNISHAYKQSKRYTRGENTKAYEKEKKIEKGETKKQAQRNENKEKLETYLKNDEQNNKQK